MQGMDRIAARIAEEAQEEVRRQEENAKQQAYDILSQAKAEAEAAYEARMEESRAAAEEIRRRALSTAKLDAKKKALATKQELLGQAFAKAREKLAAMQGAAYESFLLSLIEGSAEGGETVCFSARDEAIAERIVKAANDRLAKRGAAPVNNGGADGSVPDGLILKKGPVEQNLTLDAIVRAARPGLTPAAAEILFRGNGDEE